MHVHNLDSDQERDLLNLGRNIDLYVRVDRCDDDNVEYVSVGSSEFLGIDEATC